MTSDQEAQQDEETPQDESWANDKLRREFIMCLATADPEKGGMGPQVEAAVAAQYGDYVRGALQAIAFEVFKTSIGLMELTNKVEIAQELVAPMVKGLAGLRAPEELPPMDSPERLAAVVWADCADIRRGAGLEPKSWLPPLRLIPTS